MLVQSAAADRNLLFGILAVQMDFVTAERLIAGMNAWVLEKSKPLGAHLLDAGALSPDAHDLLQALVDKHIEQHGGRVEQSLAALSSAEPICQQLADIHDSDVQASLILAGGATPRSDRHATVAMPRRPPPGEEQRFQILRPHAMGGLGKVSVARDKQLNREVALKELQDRHADNPDSRARFLQEAEITGALEHPGVVPIYGLGQYADGRPFYAMRFIRGDSLAQAIDRFHRQADAAWSGAADMLHLRRLLGRFLDVCNAVEYAHSRGVLHRDLKPGNIMLGQYGETLIVDWGLAKPLGRADADAATQVADDRAATVFQEPALELQSGSGSTPTQMGSALGTPAYMSPEQAAGRLDQLGPASDVYSLGATLYVLLTGVAPQNDDDLGVVLQRVQRGEFPRPREVKPAVPRALEAVCLKAMALSPADRYRSPRKLAEEIEAWLADEPVAALPEGPLARTSRWIKRHRTLVTSGAAMVLVALAGLIAANLWLRAANQREHDAKTAAIAAQQRAEAARAEAERQTARNQALLALAQKSLQRYETLSRSDELTRYGMEKLRGDLLEAALEFYAALAQQAGESESARAGRADALHRLGGAYWQLGRMAEAVKAYNGALDIYRALERDYPDNAAYPYGAAKALSTLGEIRNEGYDAGAAAPLLAEGLQRFRRLHLASPGDVDLAARFAYLHSLEGERLRQLGQMSEAAEVFARGIEVLRSVKLESLDVAKSRDVRYQLSRALSQLARLQTHALWQFKPAREHYDEAIAIMRGVYQEAPELGDCAFTLAQILRNSGDLYGREFYLEQAKAAYEEGLAVLAALEQRHPDVPHYRQERAELHQSLGGLHAPFEPGNMTDDGLAHAEQAAAIGKQLVARFPEQVDRRVALARYQSSLAHLYLIRGRTDEAQAVYTEACDTLAAVGETTGKHVDVLYTLAEIQYTVADQLADSGRTDSALELLEQCEQNLNRLTSTAPQLGEAYLSLANLHITRSECFETSSRFVDAAAELDRVAAAGAKTQSMATAPWMRSTMQAILSLAKPLKWGYLKRAREGALLELAKSGQFDQLQRQCRRLAEVTGEASDHYIAAQTLAASAGIAAAAEGLEEPKRQETAESLAAAAVDELRLAWEAGYIRRTRGLGGLLRAQPTVKQMLEDEQLQPLAQRPDFQQLLERIRAENPPRRPTAPDAPAPSP